MEMASELWNTSTADLRRSAFTLASAARRAIALALVDASLAVPRVKPVCDGALEALSLRPSNGKEFMYYRKSKCASVLLILAHPSEQTSLCHTLADAWEESLRREGVEVNRLELRGADNYGLSNAAELRASLRGGDAVKAVPAQVQEFQQLVENNQFLVFVHPVFWFDVPCQLKGFLESVLSTGFAFYKLPSHWVLDRAAGVLERLPLVRNVARRYAAYGLLRDKNVYVTRTQGGPSAGMGIFGHAATSLESSVQFCGAHLVAVDVIGEIDSNSPESIKANVLPKAKQQIDAHCRGIAANVRASSSILAHGDPKSPSDTEQVTVDSRQDRIRGA